MDEEQLVLLQFLAEVADNPNAQLELAMCYARGNGVPQSYEEALKWCRKADAKGIPEAKELLLLLENMLEQVRIREYAEKQVYELNKLLDE